ncbi:bcl-2-like protein 15 isoform X2 [Erythrolamprus reginae]|uniref:bcl-2-like protein 15 isoform X2 n=1 Tax=Erythrolamprus reginae TaxID=121349 RepID=UPI00396C79DC
MNNSMTFEEQTEQIVEALFATLYMPWLKVTDRCLELQGETKIVVQGAKAHFQADSASSFDPVHIANLLKSLGDQYNEEIEGQVKAVIAKKSRKMIKKFGEVAESLSRNWVTQTPGLEPVKAFLAVAVKMFEKLMEETHGDKGQINILTETINRNPEVKGYIESQGGWGNLARSLSNP